MRWRLAVNVRTQVLVVDDKGVRPTGLNAGDVVVYHQEGHRFLLTEQGEVILTCKKFTIQAEQEILFETPQTRFSRVMLI